ncbi:ribosome biogenesis protein BMS1 homolog [Papaver somniferum]|nr:ribosome biogenesis protein BMS1 homolog [Papaver somniferum]XP_026453676.1 ribosome biogenesis protein BMS1 homolog [Papaver somniferum]
MEIGDNYAFRIYRGRRNYDDEQPLNKNTPNLDFPRPIDDPAPYIVVVQGPRKVGKSLLIESIVKSTQRPFPYPQGTFPTVLVPNESGIRLQFVECPDDINGMIDAAKYADVAILMVDASYGFEQETFEFRNLLQVHGFPKVIGVLTHLDKVALDEMSKVKQRLEDHFCTEIYEGAKLLTLSGLENGLYKMPEIGDLREMLSDPQFLPLSWRAKHPYVLVDCFEDVTSERVHGDRQFNRNLSLYGYLRGCNIKKGSKVHIAGVGDFSLAGVTTYYDPCPVHSFGNFVLLDKQSTGTYVRLDFLDVPPEIVEKFDPHHPILVGGILPEEENSGYMQVKLKRHSWRMDLLMTGAPITVSAGWRRYETTAIYAMENEYGHHQLLNYTPEHKECLAVFWGPLAPPKTRIVAVMTNLNCLKDQEEFRIMAKGIVLVFNLDAKILLNVEKIVTLVDTCWKTARIKFAPNFQIDGLKFIGAPIQTKSGVRGKIDKVVGDRLFECTFKDYVHMGDTLFFPVPATLALPALFKQFNLLSKPLEFVEASMAGTVAAVAAITAATVAVAAATIPAAAAGMTNLATIVEYELAVSYKKVAWRKRKFYQRHGVVICEGKPSFVTLPNPLESAYSSVVESAYSSEEWKPLKRSKFSVCHGQVISRAEPTVIKDGEEVTPLERLLRRHGGKLVLARQ